MEKLKQALLDKDFYLVNDLLYQIDHQILKQEEINFLNELLLNPEHYGHQVVAKLLQGVKSPSSIPYVRQVLASGFDFLAYTCSEDGVIAKWFSHLLASIGTPEAIDLMREYANDENEGIREEMNYRLKKVLRIDN
jgi:HEAT repeat protein